MVTTAIIRNWKIGQTMIGTRTHFDTVHRILFEWIVCACVWIEIDGDVDEICVLFFK